MDVNCGLLIYDYVSLQLLVAHRQYHSFQFYQLLDYLVGLILQCMILTHCSLMVRVSDLVRTTK